MIQELMLETDPLGELELPELMEPLRPEDAPGAQMDPADGGHHAAGDASGSGSAAAGRRARTTPGTRKRGRRASVEFRAGEAYAVLSGTVEPGAARDRRNRARRGAGLRLHGFQFTPLPPR